MQLEFCRSSDVLRTFPYLLFTLNILDAGISRTELPEQLTSSVIEPHFIFELKKVAG